MRLLLIIYGFLFFIPSVECQSVRSVTGAVLDARSKEVLKNCTISIEGSNTSTIPNDEGFFILKTTASGRQILAISSPEYVTVRLPIHVQSNDLDLGKIILERNIQSIQSDNLITLTDAELFDDELNANPSALLQATRDIFLSRAAFDFGQAFFRVRGYDSQYGKVLINGLSMNKFTNGRPQWNNWGGLNDITRNQQLALGLQSSPFNFGGILGTTNIDTRPSKLRPGMRFSSSISNRTYAGRLMASYISDPKNGLAYSLSASRRWAKQGYIDGTLYDAFSFFGALEYKLNATNSLVLTSIYAFNRRGISSAITEEVVELVGKQFNPYWGLQEGEIRNSRERVIAEPLIQLNHHYSSERFKLNTGISYQFGTNAKSRLGYYNAANPDPTYYRYLPSFYVNSPIGANFVSANAARSGFQENPQLKWNQIYVANASTKAAYVLYNDTADESQFSLNSNGNATLSKKVQFDFGFEYRQMNASNYAKIIDLFGAEYHTDIDPFSDTSNDVLGEQNKKEDALFNYHYRIDASELDAFTQLNYSFSKWDAFLAANYKSTSYQREGIFQNESFLDSSIGKSRAVRFSNYGIKGGLTYRVNGRHIVTMNTAQIGKPPVLQNVFINPRENNLEVPNLQSEKISSIDVNYHIRLPKVSGRISGYYTRFQNSTDVNFFFVDAGVGSDFVQEVLTDLDKLQLGIELGLEYKVSASVKLSAVAAVGKYLYASNPSVVINFDTFGDEADLINFTGNLDLGAAAIKDYRLAQGPQKAFSIGVNYRDPNYWWVGTTANFMAANYANISTLTRTQSFYLNPETEAVFQDATAENVKRILTQNSLDDIYLLNLIGGKSWLKKGKYISVFASINNVFDSFFRTGGYEQSRNGNYGQLKQDNLSGTPSFAPKYWYGYGRTFFLNLAYSF